MRNKGIDRRSFLKGAVTSAAALIGINLAMSVSAFANKSSAAIDVPDKAAKGYALKIKVTVSHKGNNFLHHTEWAYVKVNGKEIARWDFSWTSLPETEVFSREVNYTLEGQSIIEAEASCNIHGSSGKVEKKVELE